MIPGNFQPPAKFPVEFTMTDDFETILARIEQLRLEHRDLDDVIDRLSADAAPDLLQLQRLKKRKLVLKDLIAKLASGNIPDIIA